MMITARKIDRIAYRERQGTGPCAVLLHGIGSNAEAFDPLIESMPADWRVVAWNAPGYDGSDLLAEDWPRARDYARELARFTDALGLSDFVLVGHSLGTLMAAAYALEHPARVRQLVLGACAAGYRAEPGAALPASTQARLDDLERLGPVELSRLRAPRLLHEAENAPDALARVAWSMSTIRPDGYRAAVRMLACADLAKDAADLTVPTHVVVGAQDVVTPPEQSRGVFEALPAVARGTYTELPLCGHALHLQAPDRFAQIIRVSLEEGFDVR